MTAVSNGPEVTAVFRKIQDERARQDAKWGKQNHAFAYWHLILAEETGELAEAILEGEDHEITTELVQVAAVAVAWLEQIELSKQRTGHARTTGETSQLGGLAIHDSTVPADTTNGVAVGVLRDRWLTLERAITAISPASQGGDLNQLRSAFYSGASAMFAEVVKMPDMSEEELAAFLRGIRAELLEYLDRQKIGAN